MQDHGREPDSDDELLLMTEVDSLQSQLKKLRNIQREYFIFVHESLESKSLAHRIRKWTNRRDQLRNMADRHHATSGGPAVSLDVARTGLKADKQDKRSRRRKRRGSA